MQKKWPVKQMTVVGKWLETLHRQYLNSHTGIPEYKLPPETSHRQHREQEDQEHRRAEIQDDAEWRGRDDCCEPDLSHPQVEAEDDELESHVGPPD